MFRTACRLAALTTVATGAAVLLGAALAAAHIETDPPAVQAGTQATVGFVVEHGCGESNTTGMDIKLPAGITDATASKQGWTVSVADGVVRFSGGDLDHDTEDTFDVSFTAPTAPGFVTFPTVQICGDTQQPWLDETVEGQPEPEHPAPRLEITQGPPTSDELTIPVDTDDDADGTTTTAAAATTTTQVATTTAPATTAATTTAAPTTAAATTVAPTTAAPTTAAASSTTAAATTTTTLVVTSVPADDEDGGSNAGWWIAGIAALVLIGGGAALLLRRRGDTDAEGPPAAPGQEP